MRAGTVIFAMSIIIWTLLYFPRPAEVESAIADDFGYAQTEDTHSLEYEKSIHGKLAGKPVFNIPVALSIMVFFALCMQCVATLAVIAKELNWRWAIASFFTLTGAAWVAAVLTYQIGILFV